MITLNNSFYISSDYKIYKTDKYLNVINQYIKFAAFYRGLYYNSLNNTIYVAGYNISSIDVFDLNLTLVDSIPTLNYQPYSLQGYKNYIYVGVYLSGKLLVIENKVIIKTFSVCSSTPTSILIDHYGYMAISCFEQKSSYLYYSANVSYTGRNLTYTVKPYFMNFDSNGRFDLISPSQIDIYY